MIVGGLLGATPALLISGIAGLFGLWATTKI
jgi:hypothetical protein